jgi:RND family efflux transporter MFP subunit
MYIKPNTMIKSIAFLGVFSFLFLLSCSKKETTESAGITTDKPSNTFYVKTSPISNASLQDVIHVTGVILSDTEAKPSFKTGGVIASTFVEEGDQVKKGQLLARLNMTEIEAQSTQAKFAVDKALRDQQRVENLYRDSIATLEQQQNATTAVEMAKKTLQIAEFNVAYSEIHSPIDGKVIKQMLQEGEVTGPGIPVYYIMGVKQTDWKLMAGLTDKNWGRLKAGDKATITLDAYPGWSVEGKVIRLADVANPLSGTFDAEISIPSKDKRIAAGLLAHIEIKPAAQPEYPVIPIEALVSSDGRSGIVYIAKNGVAEKRHVLIEQFQGEQVSIRSGLEGITDVITAGSGFLEEGDKITIEH